MSDKFKRGMTVSQTEPKRKNKSLVFLENLTSGINFFSSLSTLIFSSVYLVLKPENED